MKSDYMPRKRPAFTQERMEKFMQGYLHPKKKRAHPVNVFPTEKELDEFLIAYRKKKKETEKNE